MAAINKSTLFSSGWSNIYSIVNTRSNIADPSDSSGSRKFIYSRLPNIKGDISFPFIVLNQPKIINQTRPSLNAKRKMVSYAIEIEVYTSDFFTNGNVNGKGQNQLNSICDDVYETFNKDTVRQTLKDARIENVNIITNDMNVDMDLHNNIVYIGSFTLTFSNKKDVY
jgi:hypothetical protein